MRVLQHTETPPEEVGRLAAAEPGATFLLESGYQKLLYYFADLEALLAEHPNVFLCTYNLCNWLALERLCARGLGGQLLYGSHSPAYNPHAAMAMVALGDLTWEEKCDIAGNNLRRVLGMEPVLPEEVPVPTVEPFIIDAHVHSGPPGRFPVPDESFGPPDWLRFMDGCALERLYVCPYESLVDARQDPEELTRELRAAAPGRFRYFEVFDPRDAERHLARIERSLEDPDCVGVKVHPSFHGVPADDGRYVPLYDLSERLGFPILGHSWEASETNPAQELSHPWRYEFQLFPGRCVPLTLGHAGGRPGALEAVAKVCESYPFVDVDLAGDYFDTGLVDCLVDRLGEDRVIFGSDMNWIDPRAVLGPVLGSSISDEQALAILRRNALWRYEGWR